MTDSTLDAIQHYCEKCQGVTRDGKPIVQLCNKHRALLARLAACEARVRELENRR